MCSPYDCVLRLPKDTDILNVILPQVCTLKALRAKVRAGKSKKTDEVFLVKEMRRVLRDDVWEDFEAQWRSL